jgi:hypothetical protein
MLAVTCRGSSRPGQDAQSKRVNLETDAVLSRAGQKRDTYRAMMEMRRRSLSIVLEAKIAVLELNQGDAGATKCEHVLATPLVC